MKKSLIFLVALLLLTAPILAQEPSESNESSLKERISDSINSTRSSLKNNNSILNNLSSFKHSKNDSLTNESILKEEINFKQPFNFLKPVLNIVNGQENQTWEDLVISLMVLITLFVIFVEAAFFTSLESSWTKAVFSFAGLAILTVIGALELLISLLYDITNNLKIILTILACLIAASFLTKPFLKKFKNDAKRDKAKILGTSAGTALESLSKTSEAAANAARS